MTPEEESKIPEDQIFHLKDVTRAGTVELSPGRKLHFARTNIGWQITGEWDGRFTQFSVSNFAADVILAVMMGEKLRDDPVAYINTTMIELHPFNPDKSEESNKAESQ